MLAPEPFFEPRGTPFSEYHRIRALVELGHTIDLATYPIGTDVALPGLRIFRCARPPFVRRVRIGPSPAKAVLDVLLAATAFRLARRGPYDAIHSHEEAGVLGAWLARRLGIPHVYDMHSSLPQQLANFRYSRSRMLRALFERAERRTIDGSRVVITICQELQDAVAQLGAGTKAVLIENVMGGDVEEAAEIAPGSVRERWGLAAGSPLVLYTGTFEAYQGLDLLIDAAARLRVSHPAAQVLVVGGEPAQVNEKRARGERVGARMVFTGSQAARDIPSYVAACDILVSPRTAGTNTPLKIYSYLRSGKPIVATSLRTHTQVLDGTSALLVPPEPEPLAAALGRLIDSPDERARLVAGARRLAETRYSREVFLARTREAYARLEPEAAAGVPRPAGGGAGSAAGS